MGNKRSQVLKICCGTTAILIITLFIVLLVLCLTILKPKQPKVVAQPVGLEHIEFGFFPLFKLNVTLSLIVSIQNPNRGSFQYQESMASIYYHGLVVAQSPIPAGVIPSRRTHNISTSVEIFADRLVSDPHFNGDVGAGSLNLTTSSTLHGKVKILKIVQLHATTHTACEIAVFLPSGPINSTCNSKVKI